MRKPQKPISEKRLDILCTKYFGDSVINPTKEVLLEYKHIRDFLSYVSEHKNDEL